MDTDTNRGSGGNFSTLTEHILRKELLIRLEEKEGAYIGILFEMGSKHPQFALRLRCAEPVLSLSKGSGRAVVECRSC